jgi:hypothetical protein
MIVPESTLTAGAELFDVDPRSLQSMGGMDGAVYSCRRGSRACVIKFVPLTTDRAAVYEEKVAFLFYLAENGECTFTQIREHMLERHNIRSQKDIRIHLNDLSDDAGPGLVVKCSHGNGNACSYRLHGGFVDLKRLYNYLKAAGSGPELMRTRHFAEFTSSCDFFRKLKIIVVASIVTDLCRCMDADGGASLVRDSMRHVPPEHQEAILAWMGRVRRRDLTDPMVRRFIEMVDAGCTRDFEVTGEAYAKLLMERGTAEAGPQGFIALASDILVPDHYRDRLTEIVRLSPGAFDGVMNPDSGNPLFPRNPFLAYAISLLLAQDGLKGPPSVTVADCCGYAKGIRRVLDEPPIFVIARSHFVADLAGGRLAAKEVPAETLRLIFSTAR